MRTTNNAGRQQMPKSATGEASSPVPMDEDLYRFEGLKITRGEDWATIFRGSKAAMLRHGLCPESYFPARGTSISKGVNQGMDRRDDFQWVLERSGGSFKYTVFPSAAVRHGRKMNAFIVAAANRSIAKNRAARFNSAFQAFMVIACGAPPRYSEDPPELLTEDD